MRPPILITGAARSGTSMVAGIVHRCGAVGGTVLGPTPANKRGQYENRRVIDEVIKPYLRLQGLDPLGQNPLPDTGNLLPYDNLRQKIEAIMREEGVRSDDIWYWKGAKACLIWPVLHKAFPDAKWIIVRREKEQIVQSCLRTGFMRKCGGPAGWRKWVEHHERCFADMKSAGLDIAEVWPEEFFIGDFVAINSIILSAGLKWNGPAVFDFISPALWNGGK